MKSWKVLLGVGGACVACCALPLGAIAGFLAGAGGLAAYAGPILPALGIAAGVGLAGAAYWWRRRASARQAGGCGCKPGGCQA